MKLKRLTTIVLGTILLTGAFMLSCPQARGGGNAPEWTKGDYWEYEMAGSDPLQLDLLSEKLRIDVEGRTAISIGGVSIDSYYCSVTFTLRALFFTTTMSGNVHFRSADLAFIEERLSMTGHTSTWSYDPPLGLLRFPLVSGQTWKSSNMVTMKSEGQVESRMEAHSISVAGPRSVSVRAGTFDSFMITDDVDANHTGSAYYSDAVGYVVKTIGDTWGPLFAGDFDLVSYRYQKGNTLGMLLSVLGVISAAIMLVFVLVAIRRTYKVKKTGTRLSPSPREMPQAPQMNQYPPPPRI